MKYKKYKKIIEKYEINNNKPSDNINESQLEIWQGMRREIRGVGSVTKVTIDRRA